MTANVAGVARLAELVKQLAPDELADYLGTVGDDQAEVVAHVIQLTTQAADEKDWRAWLPWLFPTYFPVPFAAHHAELWDWVWAIEADTKPATAFIGIWARGGAKSTSAEAAAVALAARKRRKYGLYVMETQAQADDHVGNIGAMLESDQIGRSYPDLSERLLGKFGAVKGWRRNRLRTASGFTIDALGLDVAARGLKLDDERPDLMIFDDLDSETDGPGQVERKIESITKKLLPAGSDDLAVLGIQNLIHPQGIFARLAGICEEQADFLHNRVVSGPIPALDDATFEPRPDGGWTIVTGIPTWEGQDLARCQAKIDDEGITAFRSEAQHETDARGGGMFDHIVFRHCARDDLPALQRCEVWVDPAVTTTDKSDSMAIQADGLGVDGTIYRLRSWERRATPVTALKLAIVWAMLEGAMRVGVETDQGGDTWRSVYREALTAVNADLAAVRSGSGINDSEPEYVQAMAELSGRETNEAPAPFFAEAKAGSTQQPKEHRIQQMLTGGYEKANGIIHVLGTHLVLERALFRFPARKPYDLCLAEGTMIATEGGDVAIEAVGAGDRVWTRSGLRTVLAAGMTNAAAERLRVTLEDGRVLDGTYHHPVWSIRDQMWRSLGELRCGDIVLACMNDSDPTSFAPTASSTDASTSAATSSTSPNSTGISTCSMRPTLQGATTTRRSDAEPSNATPSTAKSGRLLTARSPMATSSITSTATLETTRWTTWPASRTPLTASIMDPRCRPKRRRLTWRRSNNWPPNGTEVPRAERGTANTALEHGKGARRARFGAQSAASLSPLVMPARWLCVRLRAVMLSASETPATTSIASALSAAIPSPPGSTTDRPTAAVRVLRRAEPVGVGSVFNLTVDDVPEFFANGILVHNCDAAYWSWSHLDKFGQPTTTSARRSSARPSQRVPLRPGGSRVIPGTTRRPGTR